MTESDNPFDNLPGFKESIARIARVPSPENKNPVEEFSYIVIDETHKITYRIASPRTLTPADVRRALVKAFSRKDFWPNESGEVEIRL